MYEIRYFGFKIALNSISVIPHRVCFMWEESPEWVLGFGETHDDGKSPDNLETSKIRTNDCRVLTRLGDVTLHNVLRDITLHSASIVGSIKNSNLIPNENRTSWDVRDMLQLCYVYFVYTPDYCITSLARDWCADKPMNNNICFRFGKQIQQRARRSWHSPWKIWDSSAYNGRDCCDEAPDSTPVILFIVFT